mmetsp:Transcript_15435/g.13475  ORF Transcript_15435/g.13475 Transcript_15435/m.13475 type:complete len:214 (+) Transcript_15435:658-1299(+)
MNCVDKYYASALEIAELILYLAKNVRSIHEILKKNKDSTYEPLYKFLEKDPIVCMNEMELTALFPKNILTESYLTKLLTEDIEDCIRINLMYKKEFLEQLYSEEESQFSYLKIEDTMQKIEYDIKDSSPNIHSKLVFFSEKYTYWITAQVNQRVGDDVVFIECELSSQEKNSPIFVFREVLESLDRRIFGEADHDRESYCFFYRLYKILMTES